jgi:hypothetical protein
MRKYLSLALFISIHFFAFSQQEGYVPLSGNPALESYRSVEAKTVKLAKTQTSLPRNFPITEHFVKNRPDTLFWLDNEITIIQKTALFNAQSFAGATYNSGDGSWGETDVLTTKPINFIGIPDVCYINFDYESGATWDNGDSLVLEALNSSGSWDRIWTSAPINVAKRNVSFNFSRGLLYQHATFQLRFVAYSKREAVRTETYKLFNFVFALKQTVPFYENIFWDTLHTYRRTWSHMQGNQDSSSEIKWGKVIRLNARDENGALYNNGFNDTIQSNSFDLSGFASSDSVFFRFYYRAFSNQSTDSLLVQFKNNAGIWVSQMAVSASQSGSWKKFIVNVNRNRFNHDDFQFRVIARGNTVNNDTLWMVSGFNIGKRLRFPFREDFSSTQVYPDAGRWMDRLVFINANYPIAPPSINVATFDGLDRLGVPYGTGKGACDTLTSFPFRLDQLTDADSVYLSFWVQPKGLGEAPENNDSLILELRSTEASADSFRMIWGKRPRGFATDEFTEVRILLPSQYFHDDVQLRFRNKGSRSGNFNHWHLDYIYFDRDRRHNDVIQDVAIQEFPSPLLNKYLSVPYSHFKQNPSAFLATNGQTFTARNNSLEDYAVTYRRVIFNQVNDTVDKFQNIFNNFQAQTSDTGHVTNVPNITNHFSTDSTSLRSMFNIVVGNTTDRITSNDTLWQSTYLGNYYAYDDGTAETGYAIQFSAGKVALRYVFNQPDSLYGMSIFYGRPLTDISQLTFNLKVWSSLAPEESLLSIPSRVVYYNARNGFYYVKFETPIFVQNTVYIGWEQTQKFDLNVGLDLNYKVNGKYAPNPEMFFNLGGGWQPTELWGALMIRPLVGKWMEPPPVGLTEQNKATLDVTVYPNPTNGILNVRSNSLNELKVVVFDITGKEVYHTAHAAETIDLGYLGNGLYFIRVEDKITHASKTSKILINH